MKNIKPFVLSHVETWATMAFDIARDLSVKPPIDPAREQYYFRHSGLGSEASESNIGARGAPLDTRLRGYDVLLYTCRINSRMASSFTRAHISSPLL